MPLQDLTTPPTAPARTNDSETFIARADAWVAWVATFVSEMSTLTAQLEATAALIAAAPSYADPTLKTIADSNLTAAADRLIYFTSGSAAALATITAAARSLLDDANASAMLTTLGVSAFIKTLLDDADAATARGTLGVLEEATAAQFRSNTADKALSTDQVWAAAASVALTPGTNVAVDLNSGFNFTLAMGGAYTLDNPTNGKAGQTGVIEITQDATGSRTLAYGANWKFAGGTDPVLSTAASAKDLLFYQVLADGSAVYASLVKAVA